MHAISLQYTDLSNEALIKIFQLADLLNICPKKASEIYLATRSVDSVIKQKTIQGEAA